MIDSGNRVMVHDHPVTGSSTPRLRLQWSRPKTVIVSIVVIVGLSLLFEVASAHAFSGNSDGATVVLEGASIRHGHLTLSGWSLSLDSFWSIDALFYAVAVLLGGLSATYMHLVPAVLAALTVAAGVLLGSQGFSRRGCISVIAFVVIALALPSHALAFFLLQGPWHVGTVLYCVLAFAALVRCRARWGFPIATVLLAAGLLGDLQMLSIGVVPVFVGGLIASARARSLKVGQTMMLAAPASIALAVGVRLLAMAVGTFRVSESHHTVSRVQAESDVGHLLNWGAALFGLHQGVFGGPRVSTILEAPRILILLAVAAGVIAAALRIAHGVIVGGPRSVYDAGANVDDLLIVAFLGAIVVFVELTLSDNPAYARYLDAVVVFGTLLGARAVARLAERSRRIPLGVLMVAGFVVLGTTSAVFVTDLTAPVPGSPTHRLEAFLSAHNLNNGIGDYWASSVVTVDTNGAIRIRPIVANLQGQLVSDGRNATSDWYRGQRFGFLVYEDLAYGRVDPKTIEATFGAPLHTYNVGHYHVDVWSHPLRLGTATFP